MITAVDTSVLLDLIIDDPVHADSSERLLEKAYDEGATVICEVVYAELAPQFDFKTTLDDALKSLGIQVIASGTDAAYLAGRKWYEYRKAGGSRTRLVADFLIGAHAAVHAQRLLTRDRGFYRQYFADLDLLQE